MVIVRRPIRGINQKALEKFLVFAQRSLKVSGVISVLVTNNAEMRRLNRSFRNKDVATDVLSFPAGFAPAGQVVGDLAISAQMARENAAKLGHSVEDELKVLVLHGVLHLAGYDHENDSGQMARREIFLQKKFRLPSSLIQRNNGSGMDRNATAEKMVNTHSKSSALEGRQKRGMTPRR